MIHTPMSFIQIPMSVISSSFFFISTKGGVTNKPKLLALTVHVHSHDTITKRNSGDRKILDKGRGILETV